MEVLFISFVLGVLLWGYYKIRKPAEFDRIAEYGESVLISRDLMNFGYWAVDAMASVCIRLGLTPNHISFLSLVFSGVCALFLIQESFQWAAIFFWLSAACDTCDGRVARRTQTASDAGEVVDATLDRWVDLIIFSAFVILYRDHFLLLLISLLALACNVMVSYTTAKAEVFRIDVPRGLMRRVERIVYIGVAILLTPLVDWALYGIGWSAVAHRHPLVIGVLLLIGVIGNWSAMSRLKVLYGKLKP